MIMTDSIADTLTRLRNVNRTHHDTVFIPYSRPKNTIANILIEEDYLTSISAEDTHVGKTLALILKHGSRRESAIGGL